MKKESEKHSQSEEKYDPLSDEQYERNERIFDEFLKNTDKPRRQKKSSDSPANSTD
jgi:hypothetical protein